MGSLLPWREVDRDCRKWNDLRLVDGLCLSVMDDGGGPLARTFLTQSLFDPYGSAIAKPSSIMTARTGVW